MNGRELSSYQDNTNNITYKYNLDGISTSKIVNGIETKYYLEGSSIIFEDRNGNMIYYIYNGDELLGFIYNSNTYYYHKNIFGDIIGILDSNYNEVVTYTYNSWGLLTNKTDTTTINLSTINPFRYRSYYYDEETNLYYLNSRYYNPEWGRFVNADFILIANKDIISGNLYQYASNDFVNNTDKSGKNISDVFEIFGNTLKKYSSFFIGGVGVATADGPLPFGDTISAIGIAGLTIGIGIYSISKSLSKSISIENSIYRYKEDNNSSKVYFPGNPNDFKPKGLIRKEYQTTNGKILKWFFPGGKEAVFEWHEDYKYGSHYHINEIKYNWSGPLKDAPHYKPGDEIPEPYSYIYFN